MGELVEVAPKVVKELKKEAKSERHNMRMYPEDYRKLVYWSDKFDMDKTEFLVVAMHHYIRWKNGDYDLPNAEIQRLNQLTDVVESLVATTASLENTTVTGFDSMLGIIRGENYLVEDEDGNL